MNYDVIGFPAAIFFILAILSWMIITVKGKIIYKLSLMAATGFVFFLVWDSIGNLKGWASNNDLPEKFMIHWIVIEEPSKIRVSNGGIYVLITDITSENENKGVKVYLKENTREPRLYKVPYSIEMHKKSQEAIKGLKKGKRFFGEKGKKSNSYQKMEPKFYDMPNPPLPKKNKEN